MKRVILALVLLAVVAGLCGLSLHTQVSSTGYLLTMTEKLDEAYRIGDMEECQRLARRFTEDFREQTRYFPFFMRHGDIWAIEDTVIALPVYLETEDLQHFLSELIKCRSQLEKLYQLELPLPENIL